MSKNHKGSLNLLETTGPTIPEQKRYTCITSDEYSEACKLNQQAVKRAADLPLADEGSVLSCGKEKCAELVHDLIMDRFCNSDQKLRHRLSFQSCIYGSQCSWNGSLDETSTSSCKTIWENTQSSPPPCERLDVAQRDIGTNSESIEKRLSCVEDVEENVQNINDYMKKVLSLNSDAQLQVITFYLISSF